jgi:hypothetical protein
MGIVIRFAKKYGCGRNVISNHLKKRGVMVSHSKMAKHSAEIIALYNGGAKTDEIAQRFGVGHTTIIRLLHDNGVTMRTRWNY